MKQKLVFIDFQYCDSDYIEKVYLSNGYRIVSMVPQSVSCGVTGDSYSSKAVYGQLALLLEKDETHN